MGLTWLAIGDSITNGTGATSYDKSYVYQTRTELLKRGHQHFLIRASVGGQRSDNMITMYKAKGGKCDPDLITIMIGTNDVGQGISTSTFKANVNLLIDEVYKNNVVGLCKVVLTTIPWRGDFDCVPFNNVIKQIGVERNIPVCDIFPAFSSNADLLDGVHPNDNGHQKIANILIPFLDGLDVWNKTRKR